MSSYFNWTLDKTVFEDNISKCFPYLGLFDPHRNQSSADFEDFIVLESLMPPPRLVLFAGICCFMHPVSLLLKLRLLYGVVDFALLIF